MVEPVTTELQHLLQEGRAAALAGDTFTARARFRQATELDPNNTEAWVGLSSAVPVLAEKREYLRKALVIDPGHSEARASLEYVEKLIADGLQLAPSQRRRERRESGDASPLLSAPEPETPAAVEVEFCYIHPDRETGLHCVQCGRPVCGECARPAAVGQLCPECRKARRPSNYQVEPQHMVVAGGIAVGMAIAITVVATLILMFVPFLGLFLAFFAAFGMSELTVRAIERATRKRGRSMQVAALAGVVAGMLPAVVLMMNLFLLLVAILVGVIVWTRLR